MSVFLVNRHPPKPDDLRDEAFAFQAQLDIRSDRPFIPRPDLRSLESHDWDERVADLHYRDTCECAVGHNIATELHNVGTSLQYQAETGRAQRLLYEFLNPELKHKPPRYKKFRANRSMRDVEPSVNLWLKTSDGVDIEEDAP